MDTLWVEGVLCLEPFYESLAEELPVALAGSRFPVFGGFKHRLQWLHKKNSHISLSPGSIWMFLTWPTI
jgi:hypothetical protein